jgi:hypothetical protein
MPPGRFVSPAVATGLLLLQHLVWCHKWPRCTDKRSGSVVVGCSIAARHDAKPLFAAALEQRLWLLLWCLHMHGECATRLQLAVCWQVGQSRQADSWCRHGLWY